MEILKDRTALVTGGSRGIGPHIAHTLAREGVHVAVTARSEASLQAVAAKLENLGVRSLAVTADITYAADREKIVASVVEKFDAIDILVNNAGIESEGTFLNISKNDIDYTVQTNLVAALQLTHRILPSMVKRRWGHVVTISSLAGKKSIPYDAVYSATKAGLVEWTSALRMELAETGVKLSVVCPGYVMHEGMFARFGMVPPQVVGSCTPQQVAAAVIKAIRQNRHQIIVNSMPIRPFLVLNALFPELVNRLMKWLGIIDFQRRKVGE